jgi:hypothetical protein
VTRAALQALAEALPADVLIAASNIHRHLPGVQDVPAAVAYCVAQGWLCERRQWNIHEIWRDSRPHQQATIHSKPRTPSALPIPQMHTADTPNKPTPKPKKPTTARPTGGLFT